MSPAGSMPTPMAAKVGKYLVAATLLAVVPSTACWDSRCGKGQRREGALCLPIADGSLGDLTPDAAPLSDATMSDISDASADAPLDGGSGLGDICTKQEDCTGAASFCAVIPGTPSGYCTFKDCKVGGSDCPAGYFCMDLSMYLPGLTACIKI